MEIDDNYNPDKRAKELHSHLTQITPIKKIAFSYLLVKRLFINYQVFYNQMKWGQPTVLEKSLDMLKHIVLTGNVSNYDKEIVN